jgi:hypothetical protein
MDRKQPVDVAPSEPGRTLDVVTGKRGLLEDASPTMTNLIVGRRLPARARWQAR